MPGPSLQSFVRRLRASLAPAGEGGLSDADLLERFVANRDEAAFEVLVWRHGGMVLGVARRLLRREQDAEDVFQATFLALARKAGAIGRREALACWLYQTAHRAALRVRAGAARRREQQAEDLGALKGPDELARRELRAVLDEEIARLPGKYRTVVILCYLAGLTTEEAARQLGCPRGTINSRLASARTRLRERLAGRDLALPPESMVLVLLNGAAGGPPMLVSSTVRAATLVAAGQAIGGAVAPGVAALTEGVLQAMLMTKIKAVTAMLLVALLLGAGTTRIAGPRAAEPNKPAAEPNKPAAKPNERAKVPAELEKLRRENEELKKRLAEVLKREAALVDEAQRQRQRAEEQAQVAQKLAVRSQRIAAEAQALAAQALRQADVVARARAKEADTARADIEAALKVLKAKGADKKAIEALERAAKRLQAPRK
jgi:RNA polymerase sigma factor (sigma-70 family)